MWVAKASAPPMRYEINESNIWHAIFLIMYSPVLKIKAS